MGREDQGGQAEERIKAAERERDALLLREREARGLIERGRCYLTTRKSLDLDDDMKAFLSAQPSSLRGEWLQAAVRLAEAAEYMEPKEGRFRSANEIVIGKEKFHTALSAFRSLDQRLRGGE